MPISNSNSDMLAKAEMILFEHGLDFQTIVECYLEEKRSKSKGLRSDSRGILKGKVWMSDDFNAPLECMYGYMYSDEELVSMGLNPNNYKKSYEEPYVRKSL